jgi:hypothetical protein
MPAKCGKLNMFKVNDNVSKRSGYIFDGSVRAVFQKLDGQTRYVVENKDGLLHIFNATQLDLKSESKTDAD